MKTILLLLSIFIDVSKLTIQNSYFILLAIVITILIRTPSLYKRENKNSSMDCLLDKPHDNNDDIMSILHAMIFNEPPYRVQSTELKSQRSKCRQAFP